MNIFQLTTKTSQLSGNELKVYTCLKLVEKIK